MGTSGKAAARNRLWANNYCIAGVRNFIHSSPSIKRMAENRAQTFSRDAVRVKVKKFCGLMRPEYRTFSVDPELTTFEVLRQLLSNAFNLRRNEFTISYLSSDETGEKVYLSLLSDWDLDSAFLTDSDPALKLKVDAKPFEGPTLEDWDIIMSKEVPGSGEGLSLPLVNSLVDKVELTLSRVQRIFRSEDSSTPGADEPSQCPPLDDSSFHRFLDGDGHLAKPEEFRLRVYHGGVAPSLRKVVWRHLLNIFPDGLSGQERLDYLRRKTTQYLALKKKWEDDGREDVLHVKGMVLKDVLRTDRLHPFYAGANNQNVQNLYNVLATFSLSHPDVSYCQGMSDIASPILFVMKDEACTYLCLCGLMQRLKSNFMIDGIAMTTKFQHLSQLVRSADPGFFKYLKQHHANDFYFCYRWMLLELKREFAFEDSLRMLEVMWSSLPPNPPKSELALEGPPEVHRASPASLPTDRLRFRFAHQQRSQARHHQEVSSEQKAARSVAEGTTQGETSTGDLVSPDSGYEGTGGSGGTDGSTQESSPVIQKHSTLSTDSGYISVTTAKESNWPGRHSSSTAVSRDLATDSEKPANKPTVPEDILESSSDDEIFTRSIPQNGVEGGHQAGGTDCGVATQGSGLPDQTDSVVDEDTEVIEGPEEVRYPFSELPPPHEFGGGNPLMLFLCLSLLLEHRLYIVNKQMDHNELAMHFDRMVRRNKVNRVLNQARKYFADYLQSQIRQCQTQPTLEHSHGSSTSTSEGGS